ncbi:type II toxin-antitoxin system RelE/ParE family toxin [Betaproteobacteria bacterium SCN1]|jgi:proteic killer suppression protein|nr:type II toxin-antitoxin system RelE/ParE family toxin [Betaproteobacteria bacterium SCN1]MBN8758939.1 type II toxin-antitoxin system RelE/ParE family toxin [Thiobacillus sp.]ODU91030.1 MAG: excinuclease ABC subunit A [Thiobacillus sp. SCN 65-179]OJW37933.1 MAG: excinuclease ABC subunit A [Thiobacillus sp. 65-69]
MIKRFSCRDTQALFEGKRIPRFVNIASVAVRKLQMLHAVERLESLRIPPQNRLEALKGNRKGQWSIRINDQWRICFVWKDNAAWDVEIVDYH